MPLAQPAGHHFTPCLVVFHNRSKNRDWECPYGTYDGPPKHPTIVDTAAEELWEETCAQISICLPKVRHSSRDHAVLV